MNHIIGTKFEDVTPGGMVGLTVEQVEAWCIKGPDGELDTSTVFLVPDGYYFVTVSEQNAHCTYPECKCPLDLDNGNCLKGLPEQNAAQEEIVSAEQSMDSESPAAAPPCPDAEARELAEYLVKWCDFMEAKYDSTNEYDYGAVMAVAGLRQKLNGFIRGDRNG